MHVREGARRRGRELKRNEKPFLPALSLSDPACTRPSARSRSRATPKSVFLFFLRSPALAQLVFVCRVCVCARLSARAPHIGWSCRIFSYKRGPISSRAARSRGPGKIFSRDGLICVRGMPGKIRFFVIYLRVCPGARIIYVCGDAVAVVCVVGYR